MASPPHLQLRNQFCLSLYSATLALTRAYRPLLEPLGLTYPQYLVMMALWETDGLSVSAICECTRLDTGTVTPLLKRLAAKNLLIRERSVEDERRRAIRLTPAGRQLQAAAESVPERMACLGVLTPRQAEQLRRLTETLYENLAALE